MIITIIMQIIFLNSKWACDTWLTCGAMLALCPRLCLLPLLHGAPLAAAVLHEGNGAAAREGPRALSAAQAGQAALLGDEGGP